MKPRPGAIAPLPPAGDSPSGPGEQLPAAERDACSLVLLEVSMSNDPGPEPVLEALRGASSPGCTRAVVDAIADDDAAMRDLAIAALDRRRGTLLQATIARLADAEAAQRDRLVEALEQISGASHGDDADAWLEWAERDSETR